MDWPKYNDQAPRYSWKRIDLTGSLNLQTSILELELVFHVQIQLLLAGAIGPVYLLVQSRGDLETCSLVSNAIGSTPIGSLVELWDDWVI